MPPELHVLLGERKERKEGKESLLGMASTLVAMASDLHPNCDRLLCNCVGSATSWT